MRKRRNNKIKEIKKIKKKGKTGFTLIELVAIIAIIISIVGIIYVFSGVIIRKKGEIETIKKFEEIENGINLFYHDRGTLPINLSELFFSTKYGMYHEFGASISKDGWRRDITYLNCSTFSILLSPGGNGIQDTTLSCSTFSAGGDDLIFIVSPRPIRIEKFETAIKMKLKELKMLLENYFDRRCESVFLSSLTNPPLMAFSPVENYFPYCITQIGELGYPKITTSYLIVDYGGGTTIVQYQGCATTFSDIGCDTRSNIFEFQAPNSNACADYDYADDPTDPAYEARVSAVTPYGVFEEITIGFCKPKITFPLNIGLIRVEPRTIITNYPAGGTPEGLYSVGFFSYPGGPQAPGIITQGIPPSFYITHQFSGILTQPLECKYSISPQLLTAPSTAIGFCVYEGFITGGAISTY